MPQRPRPAAITKRTNLTMPADWYDAFEAAAAKAGQPVSEWLREAGKSCLSRRVQSRLSTPVTPGRRVVTQ